MRGIGVLLALGCALQALAGPAPEVVVEGRRARIAFRLEARVPPERVLAALFDEGSLALLSGADRVEILARGPDRQEVRYTFRAFLQEAVDTYERIRVPAEGRLQVALLGEVRRGSLLPPQAASRGFWQAVAQGAGSRVAYEQETTFGRDLGPLERMLLARSGRDQAKRMAAFVAALR